MTLHRTVWHLYNRRKQVSTASTYQNGWVQMTTINLLRPDFQKGSLINSGKLTDFKNISSSVRQICRTVRHLKSYTSILSAVESDQHFQIQQTGHRIQRRCWDDLKSHLVITQFTIISLHVNCITLMNTHEVLSLWGFSKHVDTIKGEKKSEMSGQTMYYLIPQMMPECEFFPSNSMADNRKDCPPPFPRTHTSGVNIPHKQTQGQTWKSMEGSTHTLVLSAPTPPPTQTHTLSLRGYSEWWRVSVFTLSKWQPLEVLLCFLDCTVHALLSVYFPNVSICGFTLGGYCRNSILKAMMTQQQATQGLFRSPGENK